MYVSTSTSHASVIPCQDSSAPYQPDPMQLRLSGLGGKDINLRKEATPPPSLPPPPLPYTYQPQALPTNSSVNVPFLSAVISSLTAEKLAAILIQNSALGPSSIVGAPSTVPYQQQQLGVPTLPHPLYVPPKSSLSGSSYYGTEYGTEMYR